MAVGPEAVPVPFDQSGELLKGPRVKNWQAQPSRR
jgi:hypothetical protein